MALTLWIKNPAGAWRSRLEGLRFRYLPKISGRLLSWATLNARRNLSGGTPVRVLVDSTIHHHAVTHETAWVSTGTKMWGGVHPIDTGYMVRIPVHRRDSDKAAYQDINFLPGIVHLAAYAKQKPVGSPQRKVSEKIWYSCISTAAAGRTSAIHFALQMPNKKAARTPTWIANKSMNGRRYTA